MEQIIEVEQINKTAKGGEPTINNFEKRLEIKRVMNIEYNIQEVKDLLQEVEQEFYDNTNYSSHMVYGQKIYKETFVIEKEVPSFVDNQAAIKDLLQDMEQKQAALETFLKRLDSKERNFLIKKFKSDTLFNSNRLSKLEEKTFLAITAAENNLLPRRPPNNKKASV